MKKIFLSILVLLIFCSQSYAYTDVKEDYWAYKIIDFLSSEKILSGYPEGDFRPDGKMTKAEFATVLSKIIGLNIDVSLLSEHWADGYIEALKEEKIINELDYSKFEPNSLITRWEMCKMIVNSFESTRNAKVDEKNPVFCDINPYNNEEQYVAKILKDLGILAGYPDGSVGFYKTSTRAEVSCLIYNVMNKFEEIKNYGKKVIYENNIAIFNIDENNIKLKKHEFADDNEYCATTISSIEMFEFNKAMESSYKDVFIEIFSEKHPYLAYRNKFGEGNYVLAINFKTQNKTLEYDILGGYPFLHISFDEEEQIKIIDAFDIDEINEQTNNKPYTGIIIKPGETRSTSAFYVLNRLPSEKFYIDRSITTLYDSENMQNIKASSFHSAIIYI